MAGNRELVTDFRTFCRLLLFILKCQCYERWFHQLPPLHNLISSSSTSGDINDEDEVLSWLNEEDTLEIPGRIEEVNMKMLEKILAENEHVVVFFCKFTTVKYLWFLSITSPDRIKERESKYCQKKHI